MAPVSRASDERRTPRWFVEACFRAFGPCDLDGWAAKWNAQCERFCTKERSVYALRPRARRAWTQPPYSRGNLDESLGFAREMVLERRWGGATCLIPVDPSTDWWKRHVARPEGSKRGVAWLTGELPRPFHLEAYRLESQHLMVTIAPPDCRIAFDPPPWLPSREVEKFRGAKQPSVVVAFDRPSLRTGENRYAAH